MKMYEVLPKEQLDEKSLKHALAAGILGTSVLTPSASIESPTPPPVQQVQQQPDIEELVVYGRQLDPEFDFEPQIEPPTLIRRTELARNIAQRYRVSSDLTQQVVDLAFRYEDQEFPKAEDILAIIGVESSFDPQSVSRLRRDPARGLMQVRPGVWNIDPDELDDVEAQIKYGVEILKRYYQKLDSREDTLQAYNVGLTRFRRGGRNPGYVAKYQRALNRHEGG